MLYSREIAFAAAEVYARAAEQRGAWDARLEALIVDSVLRGEADEAVRSPSDRAGLGIHERRLRRARDSRLTGDSADGSRRDQALRRRSALRRAVRGPGRPAGRRARRGGRRRQGGRLDRGPLRRGSRSSPVRSSTICWPPTSRPAPRSPGCGRPRPGRRRRARCRATTCCPSGPSPVTVTPAGSWSTEIYQPLVEAGSGLLET